MNNNKKQPDIQFTKLTPKDLSRHKECCIRLLMNNRYTNFTVFAVDLHEAIQRFYNTFK